MAIIEFENVTFSYGDFPALNCVNLEIEEGGFVCVLGANGSGKTTLALHMNGLLVPDEGVVRVLGLSTGDGDGIVDVRSSVGLVFQNPDDQIVATLVKDDIAFGPANLGASGDEVRLRVSQALEKVGLTGFEERDVSTLSGGQKQLVALAGALAMQPKALVLDEASAMLDAPGRANLLRLCRKLANGGTSVVFVTHLMEEAACADRVIVLQRGEVALADTAAQVLSQTSRLTELGLIAPFRKRERQADAIDASDDNAPLRPILEFDAVSFAYQTGKQPAGNRVLDNLSLSVGEGEIVGIEGNMGTGKSTLLQLASGLLHPTRGRVLLCGADLADKRAASHARRDVGVVFQYPEHQLFAATVFDDVAFGPRNHGLSEPAVEERVREALAQVGLDFDELRERSPFSLSGGQQRLVAIAGVLACHPRLLVLDEPTAGLDPMARCNLLHLIDDLNAFRGLTIMVASHSHDDLVALCDRIVTVGA